MPFTLDPEIGAGIANIMGGKPPPPPIPAGDVEGRRERVGALIGALVAGLPDPPDVETKDIHVKSFDGKEILLRWFAKKGSSPGSAVLYLHGGGMIALSVDTYDKKIRADVSYTGVPVLAVDYRLAPEYPAPTLVNDAYAGLQYLHDHATDLGVDPHRIAVMGDSAGGGIAAALTHLAKEKNGPPIKKQILVYPMLDDRNLAVDEEIAPFAFWTAADNQTGWGALLGGREGGDDVRTTEAPARMTVEQARGLPPAYIDVGQLDIFAEEDLEYARILGKAGVDCEFHLIPSVPHAFSVIAPDAEATRAAIGWRMRAIMNL